MGFEERCWGWLTLLKMFPFSLGVCQSLLLSNPTAFGQSQPALSRLLTDSPNSPALPFASSALAGLQFHSLTMDFGKCDSFAYLASNITISRLNDHSKSDMALPTPCAPKMVHSKTTFLTVKAMRF